MNKKVLTLVALTTVSLFSAANASAAVDGTVNFTGSVTNAPCVVSPASGDQNVALGMVKTSDFQAAGDKTAIKSFSIDLERCDFSSAAKGEGGTSALVTFNGMAAEGDASFLALGNDSTAKNLAIELLDNESTPISINTQESAGHLLIEGDNRLTYGARYVSTAAGVTPGAANATMTFTLAYL